MTIILQTFSQLQTEINEMENLRLYYESRILAKRIAMAEIVHSAQCQQDQIARVDDAPAAAASPVPAKRQASEETRLKMSEAHLKRWEKRRLQQANQTNGVNG
jgi:hypothetical protein